MATERVDIAEEGSAGEAAERAAAGELGRRIVRLRKRRGWQQAELAQRLGVPRSTLGNWERGVHTPSLAALRSLQRELGVSFDELLSDEPPVVGLARGQQAEARTCIAGLVRLMGLSRELDCAAPRRRGHA
jgi:transcriptional regulator with XRE-family HTH domain